MSTQSQKNVKNEAYSKNSNDINNEEEKNNIDTRQINEKNKFDKAKTLKITSEKLTKKESNENEMANSCKNVQSKEGKSIRDGTYKLNFNNQNFSQLTFNDLEKLNTENNISVLSQNKLDTGRQKKITFNNDTKFYDKNNLNSNKLNTLKSRDSQNNELFFIK